MTIALWCILVAAFLPLVWTAVAKFSGPGFNNKRPREFLESLDGFRKRAHWAQLNSLEAFPPFAAAVLVAEHLQAQQDRVDLLALSFIGLRIAYGICYLGNWATLRSLVWLLAVGCVVGLFVVSA